MIVCSVFFSISINVWVFPVPIADLMASTSSKRLKSYLIVLVCTYSSYLMHYSLTDVGISICTMGSSVFSCWYLMINFSLLVSLRHANDRLFSFTSTDIFKSIFSCIFLHIGQLKGVLIGLRKY